MLAIHGGDLGLTTTGLMLIIMVLVVAGIVGGIAYLIDTTLNNAVRRKSESWRQAEDARGTRVAKGDKY